MLDKSDLMQTKFKLNTYSLTMIVVGLVIGLGIFRTASNTAQASIHPIVFFLAWIIGGLIAITGALSYAEIGARMPTTGAYYKIFAYAYHPSIAFALNCVILISNAASLSGVALIGAEYLSHFVFASNEAPSWFKPMVGIIAIGSFYFINLFGLKISSRALNVLMAIKLGMLALIIIALFVPSAYVQQEIQWSTLPSTPLLISSLGAALISVCFTFGGYQQTINFGEEIENPSITMPRGILMGLLIVIVIYFLANSSYFFCIGFDSLKSSSGVAAIVAGKLFGPIAENLFSILLFIAVLAYVDVLLLSNPRVMYAMAKDEILPQYFLKTYGKNQTLIVSLSVFTFISIIVLFFAETFDRLLGFVMFLDSLGMAFSVATLFKMRKNNLQPESGSEFFKMKYFPLAPIIFMICYLFVSFTILKNQTVSALIGIGVFIFFILIYWLVKKLK